LLTAAGWGVVEGSRIQREFPITLGRLEGGGRRGKPLSADYVLIHRNTKLAVLEAKADTAPLSEGVAIAAGSDRILLTLATGTGKTSIAFQILWKLFQAR